MKKNIIYTDICNQMEDIIKDIKNPKIKRAVELACTSKEFLYILEDIDLDNTVEFKDNILRITSLHKSGEKMVHEYRFENNKVFIYFENSMKYVTDINTFIEAELAHCAALALDIWDKKE